MNKNIIVIGASNSSKSINKQLANYAASKLTDVDLTQIDIAGYNETKIFSADYAVDTPNEILELKETFNKSDGFIISFAEHNGSYTTAYKNVIDWISVQDGKPFNGKPTLLLATSPGARGGSNVLASSNTYYPHMGAEITGSLSIPSFNDNFTDGKLSNKELEEQLMAEVANFSSKI
jgi:NAD(P)H-dependent FMN reductase